MHTRKTSQGDMSKFKPTKTSTLIFLQVILEILLDEVYGVIVNVLLKFQFNLCCRNLYISDYAWVMILIQFELLLQPFIFY